MLYNRIWYEIRALRKAALVVALVLLPAGAGVALLGRDSLQAVALSAGMIAFCACAYVSPQVKMTGLRFWVSLFVVAIAVIGYNLLCFGSDRWRNGSFICLFMFLVTSFVRSDHGVSFVSEGTTIEPAQQPENED
jgi:hypothetical protein